MLATHANIRSGSGPPVPNVDCASNGTQPKIVLIAEKLIFACATVAIF